MWKHGSTACATIAGLHGSGDGTWVLVSVRQVPIPQLLETVLTHYILHVECAGSTHATVCTCGPQTPCLSVIKTTATQGVVPADTSRSQSITEGGQGRDSSRSHGGTLLTYVSLTACLAYSLIHLGPLAQGWPRPQLTGPSLINH